MAAVSTTGTNFHNFDSLSDPTTRLFPLTLVPFERYMLADDRPDYPMAFAVVVELAGKVQVAALESAIQEAIANHPLLYCRIERVPGRGLCWLPVPQLQPRVDWGTENDPVRCPAGERIDLFTEPGLRIWIRHSSDSVRMTLQFHHACCDGVGATVFVGDLLAFYALRTATQSESPVLRRPLAAETLTRRHPRLARQVGQTTRAPSLWGTCRKAVKLLARRPVPLARPEATDRNPPAERLPFPPILSDSLLRSEHQKLREAARRKGVTSNDLYLSAMFHTLRTWNERHRSHGSNEWLRIGLPINMRCYEHDAMPAANVVSYMFLTRRAGECDDAEALLDSIGRQTTKIRQDRFGMYFITALGTLCRIPRAVPLLLRANSCYASVIVGNMGDVTRAFRFAFPRQRGRCVVGNLVLERLLGSAPVRSGTYASVCVGTYAGRLFVNLHADPRVFSAEHARNLLSLYIECLKRQDRL